MQGISSEGRRLVERLLAGESLNDLAPAGDPVRAEVEAYLVGALESPPAAPTRTRSRRSAADAGSDSLPDPPKDGRPVAFSDGASRGNPGPAAVGIRIVDSDGQEIWSEGRRIGRVTNNVAEYRGALLVLEKALELGLEKIELRLDSELVVKQLNGQYRVKQPALAELKAEVDALIRRFASFRVRHIPRAQNAAADRLANEAYESR